MLLSILRSPYKLVRNDEIYLGRVNNARLLEWKNPDIQTFIRNLLHYAVLRDRVRAEYKN